MKTYKVILRDGTVWFVKAEGSKDAIEAVKGGFGCFDEQLWTSGWKNPRRKKFVRDRAAVASRVSAEMKRRLQGRLKKHKYYVTLVDGSDWEVMAIDPADAIGKAEFGRGKLIGRYLTKPSRNSAKRARKGRA